jgi:acyl-[acyl-carrier-protein]-phospholipid O-acyltransferase/long-chain-fatty-acid--[acyl-carrier-protein] ligase
MHSRAGVNRLTELTWCDGGGENQEPCLPSVSLVTAMWFVIGSIFRRLLRVRVIGDVGPCERERRVLIVANHPSRFTGLVLGLFLPRRPMVVLPPGETRGFLEHALLRLVEHVVLDVNNPAIVKRLLRVVRGGRPLVVFPEGRENKSQRVMKIYPVPALVALKSGASIVPVSVEVSQTRFFGVPVGGLMAAVTLRVRTPTRIDTPDTVGVGLRRADAARQLTNIMQELNLMSLQHKPVFGAFLDAISRHGRSREMIEDQDEQVKTYGFVLKASLAISRWIRQHTRPGENVGLLLPNVIPSVCAVMGLSAAGRVPAILNYTSGAAGVKSAAVAADVRIVITSSKFISRAKLEPVLEALKEYRILYLEDIRAQFGVFDKLWLICFAIWFPRQVIAKPPSSDPAVVLFTSGSEDRPKGVVLSHDAILSNVAQIRSVFDFSVADKILNPLPIYHAYSFTAGLMLSLVTGTPMFLYISPLKYRAIPEISYRRDCTVLYGTSTFLSYYGREAEPVDFRTLRCVISGGEKLSVEVARLWQDKFGLRIYEGYGATEAGPVVSLATAENYRLGTAGRFLPGVDWRIQSVEGIDQGGLLHIRGPNLMLGYYRFTRPGVIEPPASAMGEGWYDTGDVVDIDRTGMVKISGRIKRFAKIAGEMVSLDVVEQVARTASPEHCHAAILLFQEHDVETIVLFTTDESLNRPRLLDAARISGAHDLSAARKVLFVPEIPVLASGKTDYVGLKSLIENETYTRLLSVATGHTAGHSSVEINNVDREPGLEQTRPHGGASPFS